MKKNQYAGLLTLCGVFFLDSAVFPASAGQPRLFREAANTVHDAAASEGVGSGTDSGDGEERMEESYIVETPGGGFVDTRRAPAQTSGGGAAREAQGGLDKPKTLPLVRTDEYYRDMYFPPERAVSLTEREQWILAKVNEGRATGWNANPMYLPDGTVQYVYGTAQPSILCAPLQLTDIELEPGEILNSLNVGDPARWQFEAAISSSAQGDIQHVILKPMDIGITTSMVIATNRRTYSLRLKSTQEDYFAKVSFAYPDGVLLKGQVAKARADKERDDNTLDGTGEYLGGLSFEYKVTATRRAAGIKPIRVYNDGVKTILEMPPTLKSAGDMPVLLVVNNDGGLFKRAETTLINYRVQSNRFVVDGLFDMAHLVRGVGTVQDRVVIERIQKRGK